MTQILVAVMTPGKGLWEMRHIENTLDAFQEIVGGPIEGVFPSEDVVLYCHEEGKLIGLPACAAWVDEDGFPMDVLCGPLVLTGPADEEGYETSITEVSMRSIRTCIHPIIA